MRTTDLNVGPAAHTRAGVIQIGQYGNGEIALIILDHDGEEQAVATVALDAAKPVGPSQLWLKGWSENEGIPQALQDAGLVKLTGGRCQAGYASAELADVLPPLAAEIAALLGSTEPQDGGDGSTPAAPL